MESRRRLGQALEERCVNSTTRVRQARYTARQREIGRVRPGWWLDRDVLQEIRRMAALRGGDQADAINTVLRDLLKGIRKE